MASPIRCEIELRWIPDLPNRSFDQRPSHTDEYDLTSVDGDTEAERFAALIETAKFDAAVALLGQTGDGEPYRDDELRVCRLERVESHDD
jgi:hypothetical protein